MKNKSTKIQVIIPLLTVFSDAVSIFCAFLSAYWLRFFFRPFTNIFPVTKGIPEITGYIEFSLIVIPIWIIIFQSRKMYRLKRSVFVMDELFVIIKCISIGVLIAMGLVFILKGDFPYSRLVFSLVWLLSIVFVTAGRYFMLKIEKNLYNKNKGVSNVAILGTNQMADKIYENFSSHKFTGYNVIGYFSIDENITGSMNGKNHLGNYELIPGLISKLNIEKIFISIPSANHDTLYNLFKICEGKNIEFMYAPDFIDMMTSRLRIEEVDGIPFMKLKSMPMNVWNRFTKRVFDIVVSSLALIFLFPVMLIIGILVKVTSKGPLFYNQERVGLDGQKFIMLKFRSMKIDAEKRGPQMTTRDDDRYTSIGRTLRKYSLDELPQFYNVLIGNMSIVGPRPEREFFINTMKHSIQKYLERHRVKGGMTGWAQVSGLRGTDSSMQTRIDYDIYYIENWSIAFDIKIIFKTIKEVLFSKEAF
ncbi:MAG TPA: undecaprenyl-phosphate glucose phosphotransferase [Ignavibacteria bacterium]|nr:undecaprenyl-phosphate glucose phosphotransferase [Ignavibacteria bacterium]HRJ98841.1 undecaprenyl-phosphate glucose phosphotransferase [Ignavibacteria bacterium]